MCLPFKACYFKKVLRRIPRGAVRFQLVDLSRARLCTQALLGSMQERRRIKELAPPLRASGSTNVSSGPHSEMYLRFNIF